MPVIKAGKLFVTSCLLRIKGGGVCCRGVSHYSLIDQSCLSVSLQGCLDRTQGIQKTQISETAKIFMLNEDMVGVWGFI